MKNIDIHYIYKMNKYAYLYIRMFINVHDDIN